MASDDNRDSPSKAATAEIGGKDSWSAILYKEVPSWSCIHNNKHIMG